AVEVDRPAGHGEVGVGHAQPGAEARAVDGGGEVVEVVGVLRRLPEHEVRIAARAHERVGVDHELLPPLADQLDELPAVRGLDLGVQPAPRGVHLVEREADELAPRGLLLLPADLLPGVLLERGALGQAGPHAARHVPRDGAARIVAGRGPFPGARGALRAASAVAIDRHETSSLRLQVSGAVARQGTGAAAGAYRLDRPCAEVATTRGVPQVPGPSTRGWGLTPERQKGRS